MKRDTVMRVAIWLADLGLSGPNGEAFAGDLLELFAAGRSRWWCFAQALRRTLSAVEQRLRSLLVPLWYSIGFVLLHPMWQRLYTPSVASLLARYRDNIEWPGSAVLEIIAGLLPALLFVCLGTFVYARLRRQSLNLHPAAAFLSVNVGVGLLFLATMGRLDQMHHDLHLLSRADFYYPLAHARFSILLFLSVFGAVVVLPRAERPRRSRRYPASLLGRTGFVRVAKILGFETFVRPQICAHAVRPHAAERTA